jgi:DNA modification methylase
LRDYGCTGQIGLEETTESYIKRLVEVFSEVYRVLKKTGTCWINIGDTYNGSSNGRTTNYESDWCKKTINKNGLKGGSKRTIKCDNIKNKDLIGIPWMLAFALRDLGFYLRQDIIWHKTNPMTESVKDRCTKSHEYIFLLTKSENYYFDSKSIREPQSETTFKRAGTKNEFNKTKEGSKNEKSKYYKSFREYAPKMISEDGLRNKRSVWTVLPEKSIENHFAMFPQALIVDCIKAGCPENGIVLDPFMGSGTTAVVARKLNRNYVGFELNTDYIKISKRKIYNELGLFV